MRNAIYGLALVSGVSVLTSPALAQTVPPPAGNIEVEVVTVNGSGCPLGTSAVAVAPDNTAFTVTYDDYLAEAGAGATPTDTRKNCQLNLLVHIPQGFTYAIAQADYRGFVHLEAGATALQRANYYFQGTSPTALVDHSFSGPMDDDWHTIDSADVATLVFAPCGEHRNLNINTELRVSAGTSDPRTTSFMTMDSTRGSIKTSYRFAFKRCR